MIDKPARRRDKDAGIFPKRLQLCLHRGAAYENNRSNAEQ